MTKSSWTFRGRSKSRKGRHLGRSEMTSRSRRLVPQSDVIRQNAPGNDGFHQPVSQLVNELGILRRMLMQERTVDLVAMGPFLNFMFVDDMAYQGLPAEIKRRSLIEQERHSIRISPMDPGRYIEEWNIEQGGDPLKLLLACFHVYEGETSFVDVGAHYGTLSMDVALFMNRIGMAANHHAFECGITRKLLEYNVINNGFLHQINVHPYAVGPVDKWVLVRCDLAHSEGNRITNAVSSWEKGSVTVPTECVTLDRLHRAREVDCPLVLKVDAEGAEPAILRGARSLLTSGPAALYLEFTPSAAGPGVGVDSPLAYLHDLMATRDLFDIGSHHRRIQPIDENNAACFVDEVLRSPAGWTDIVALDRRSDACTAVNRKFMSQLKRVKRESGDLRGGLGP